MRHFGDRSLSRGYASPHMRAVRLAERSTDVRASQDAGAVSTSGARLELPPSTLERCGEDGSPLTPRSRNIRP